tara:strand:+ start:39 stop:1778 length:1740 start_codon:yes stop_codon:yes gene_type:complete
MRNYLYQIFYLVSGNKLTAITLVIYFLFISIFDIIGIGIIAPYVEILTGQKGPYFNYLSTIFSAFNLKLNDKEFIVLVSFILIFIFFFKAVGNIALNWLILRFVHAKEITLRYELIRSYYYSNYEKMISNRSSDSIQNIVNLVPGFIFNTLYSMLKIISDLIICSVIIIFLFLTIGNISLILLLLLIFVTFIYDRIFAKRMFSYSQNTSQSQKKMIRGIQETLFGLKEIKILDRENFFTDSILRAAGSYAKNKIKISLITSSPSLIFEFLVISCVVTFILIYLSYNNENILNLLPILGMLALAIFRMVPKAGQVASQMAKFRSGRYDTGKIYGVLSSITHNEKKAMKNSYSSVPHEEFKSLSLENITYKYPSSNNNVINDLSFKLSQGDQIGIKGDSGSGKTTFIDLILGHLNPTSGNIYFNNSLLTKDNYHVLLNQAYYIPQEVFVIDDTLKKNIILNDDINIDNQKLESALKKSNLYELVEKMDNGVETTIGERGISLSGGQRQRIAIARSFYHDRNIIIFDESTSSLDPRTENNIIDEIANLDRSKTIIIISHKIETLQKCDKIFKIQNGQLKLTT